MNAVTLTDGRFVVPGNRWDLLNYNAFRPARVGVIIPHYQQPDQLALVLRALELQDHPPELIEVVIADDGSKTAPAVPADSPLHISVVRQDDQGFRAAAARNLGAAATTAEVLCFLDADTIPEPDYLRHLTRLTSILPDAVSVGRRRHADLAGWTPEMLTDWWSGRRTPPLLDEPRWLSDAYGASADLLHADSRSYRHVISAVMCCSRELFDDIGGFDESFRGYGGEDWEFAHRAWVNGAVLHHARRAVAWHDGPDWGDRPVARRAEMKNREALAMARLIPDPFARRSGLRYALPNIAIEIDVEPHSAGSLVTAMGCFLHEDVGIWLQGPKAEELLAQLGIDDPRVQTGPVPEFVARRCQYRVTTVGRPALPAAAFSELMKLCAQPGVGEVDARGSTAGLVVTASWAAHRSRRWTQGPVHLSRSSDAASLATVVTLDAELLGLTPVAPDADLSW
jgi:GT2 family glycosyltransferase